VDPNTAVGGSYPVALVWRTCSHVVYWLAGIWRPGWRRALPLLRFREWYDDRMAADLVVLQDERTAANLRAIDAEFHRVRAGGPVRPFDLPYDFPAGARRVLERGHE
jgi:hypothetical protein